MIANALLQYLIYTSAKTFLCDDASIQSALSMNSSQSSQKSSNKRNISAQKRANSQTSVYKVLSSQNYDFMKPLYRLMQNTVANHVKNFKNDENEFSVSKVSASTSAKAARSKNRHKKSSNMAKFKKYKRKRRNIEPQQDMFTVLPDPNISMLV